jgi:hypothetical protein
MTTDPKREAFEKWASDDGKWPAAIEWNGNGYELMQTHAAWIAWQASWQAALSQPTEVETLTQRLQERAREYLSLEAQNESLAQRVKELEARQVPTVEDINAQQWAKVDPAIAFHLIERHAEDWNHAGRLMEAWRLANTVTDPSAGHGEGWRPIETMPRDHMTRLFLCGGAVVQGFMDVTGNFCVTHEFGWRQMKGKPTHWQPRPPAPTPKDNRHE